MTKTLKIVALFGVLSAFYLFCNINTAKASLIVDQEFTSGVNASVSTTFIAQTFTPSMPNMAGLFVGAHTGNSFTGTLNICKLEPINISNAGCGSNTEVYEGTITSDNLLTFDTPFEVTVGTIYFWKITKIDSNLVWAGALVPENAPDYTGGHAWTPESHTNYDLKFSEYYTDNYDYENQSTIPLLSVTNPANNRIQINNSTFLISGSTKYATEMTIYYGYHNSSPATFLFGKNLIMNSASSTFSFNANFGLGSWDIVFYAKNNSGITTITRTITASGMSTTPDIWNRRSTQTTTIDRTIPTSTLKHSTSTGAYDFGACSTTPSYILSDPETFWNENYIFGSPTSTEAISMLGIYLFQTNWLYQIYSMIIDFIGNLICLGTIDRAKEIGADFGANIGYLFSILSSIDDIIVVPLYKFLMVGIIIEMVLFVINITKKIINWRK